MEYDYIIVGGGSAGCVLAGRLSARSANEVLLIEAGKDYPPGSEPADIADSYSGLALFNKAYFWSGLRVHLYPLSQGDPAAPPSSTYEQARIMGGGSSVNGQVVNRGVPADYDRWEELGAKGWGWNGVLPYFIKLETDHDFEGPLHGRDGPFRIRRIFADQWPGFTGAVTEALEAEGYGYLADQNGEFGDGYFPIPISNLDERRISAASAYLDAAARRRPNLAIRAETRAKRLVIEERRAVGVVVDDGGGVEQTYRAREIIVSAGALRSPAFLLRAGIGPAAHLGSLGIEVVADLPGVGRNLQDHAAVSVCAYLRPAARIRPPMRRQFLATMRFSSNHEGCPRSDMFMSVLNRTAWHPLGKRLGALVVSVNKPFSTGQVTLSAPGDDAEPRIEFNLLADERDVRRLADAVRFAARLFAAPAVRACTDAPFPTCLSERVRKLGALTRANWAKTGLFGLMLDTLPGARKRLIETLITEGISLDGLLADEGALEHWVKTSAGGIWHAACTCRMGADGDPLAVLDASCRVRGVAGLRVVDASAMPEVPSANINAPVMMLAEKAADAMLS